MIFTENNLETNNREDDIDECNANREDNSINVFHVLTEPVKPYRSEEGNSDFENAAKSMAKLIPHKGRLRFKYYYSTAILINTRVFLIV